MTTARKRTEAQFALGRTIAGFRTERSLNVDDLWPHVDGVSRNTWYRIEKGARVPDVSQVYAIIEALGVDPVRFFERVEHTRADLKAESATARPVDLARSDAEDGKSADE